MELLILLAIARRFAGIARAAGRSPSAWSAAGAAAYLGGLFVSALVVGPLLSAVAKGGTLVPAFACYLAVINVAGFMFANSICLAQFGKNLATLRSFARLFNLGAMVIATLFLISPLADLFVAGHIAGEEMVNAGPMAGLLVVAILTLLELRESRENVDTMAWRTFVVVSANVLVAALLLYSAIRASFLEEETSIIGAYLYCWALVAVGLNVLCIKLTIRSSTRLSRRS